MINSAHNLAFHLILLSNAFFSRRTERVEKVLVFRGFVVNVLEVKELQKSVRTLVRFHLKTNAVTYNEIDIFMDV
jgi:hypothetical protein